jgi:hypothetical protein
VIGVAVRPEDLQTVAEFFELFKTPWEQAVPTRNYAVVLSTGQAVAHFQARLFIIYDSGLHDAECPPSTSKTTGAVTAKWRDVEFPIYGRVARFDAAGATVVQDRAGLDHGFRLEDAYVRRVGYDLFKEVAVLLRQGQPPQFAEIATLEIHIALLRHWITAAGISLLELPPRPHGFDFVCCLTHDIDFLDIKRHKWDRTLFGFVARSSLGTLVDVLRRRRPLVEAVQIWFSLVSLPLVFLGILPDVWDPFRDYAAAEAGLPSTFFVVPFRNRAGLSPSGDVVASRAVSYEISEMVPQLRALEARGGEAAVHGIDAWRDSDAGRQELLQLQSVAPRGTAGVRMHWLYYDEDSPRRLEEAGFAYDSTCGYNNAVGFRSGTAQVFRQHGATHLAELPLAIMDTALFYPARLGLTQTEGLERCLRIIATTERFGGVVVLNWHDRSLSPERLWSATYRNLLANLRSRHRVWFATGKDTVEWFNWRRSIQFTEEPDGCILIHAPSPKVPLPMVRALVHRVSGPGEHSLDEIHVDGTLPVRLRI